MPALSDAKRLWRPMPTRFHGEGANPEPPTPGGTLSVRAALAAVRGLVDDYRGRLNVRRRDQVHVSDGSRVLAFGTTVMRGTYITNQIPTFPMMTSRY